MVENGVSQLQGMLSTSHSSFLPTYQRGIITKHGIIISHGLRSYTSLRYAFPLATACRRNPGRNPHQSYASLITSSQLHGWRHLSSVDQLAIEQWCRRPTSSSLGPSYLRIHEKRENREDYSKARNGPYMSPISPLRIQGSIPASHARRGHVITPK